MTTILCRFARLCLIRLFLHIHVQLTDDWFGSKFIQSERVFKGHIEGGVVVELGRLAGRTVLLGRLAQNFLTKLDFDQRGYYFATLSTLKTQYMDMC